MKKKIRNPKHHNEHKCGTCRAITRRGLITYKIVRQGGHIGNNKRAIAYDMGE